MARRGKPAVVATATRLDLTNKKLLAAMGRRSAQTEVQTECWEYYDAIPELKFAIGYVGHQMAKIVLRVGVIDPLNPSKPIPLDDPLAASLGVAPDILSAAQAELERLASDIGGQPEMQRQFAMNMDVAGQCYLVGQAEVVDGMGMVVRPERWDIKSVSEVEIDTEGKIKLRSTPGGSQEELNPDTDACIEFRIPHPRWSGLADSFVMGTLNDCRAVTVLSQQIIAEANSRLGAGLLLMPNEIDFTEQFPGEGDDEAENDEPQRDGLLEAIEAAATMPIEDPRSAASVVPLILRAESTYLDAIRKVDLGRPTDGAIDTRIEARVRRIARGLNLPVEVVEGLMETTFANADQIDRATYEDFFVPRVGVLTECLTTGYLRPNLRDVFGSLVADPAIIDRIVVWADPSALVSPIDPEKSADTGFQYGMLSEEAWRRVKGWTESDAPGAAELAQRIGMRRGQINADLAEALLMALMNAAGVKAPDLHPAPPPGSPPGALPAGPPPPRPPKPPPPDAETADTGDAGGVAASARPRRDTGRTLMEIDRDLRTRLIVAANAAMDRALERAGSRVTSRVASAKRGVAPPAVFMMRDQVIKAPLLERASLMGATHLASINLNTDELLDGAWTTLEGQFRTWSAGSASAARDVLSGLLSGFTTADRAAMGMRQASSIDEAWTWLEVQLRSLAAANIFNPNAAVEAVGEFDLTMKVPAGLIRSALARAGGDLGISVPAGGGPWVTLTNGGTAPAGGIATGGEVMGAVTSYGGAVSGYVWVYGPAHRHSPFEPHAQLDGVTFDNFDDDVLANNGSFPEFDFYMPGDHAGCICDFSPIVEGT